MKAASFDSACLRNEMIQMAKLDQRKKTTVEQ